MKATKAKRDSAKTTSTKDYIVQGAKEDTGSMDVETTNKTDSTESPLRDYARSPPRSSASTS